MTDQPAKHKGLPVSGYRAQTQGAVNAVNYMKLLEEDVLRALDDLMAQISGAEVPGGIDGRWLVIGRTQIEQGFMAVNRSVFKPERVKLPEDPS